jgi:hypothetical protein
MKNFDANTRDGHPLHCLVCEKEIPGGNWFARIKLGAHRVAMCKPRCMEIYCDQPDFFAARLGNGAWVEPPEKNAAG